jgi:hypothetical protein
LYAAAVDDATPSHNPFAILDSEADATAATAANDNTTGGDDTTKTATSGDDDTDREDGDSQPLLDAVTAAEGVLQSTLDAFNEEDRALDTTLREISDAADDNIDDTAEDDAAQSTPPNAVINASHPTIHPAPTLESMMVLLQNNALMQKEILLQINAMDDNSKKNTGHLRAAINSKADST